MLDFDLAELYGIETKALNQAVKRNSERFPADFMFELSTKEFENLRSQFVTAKDLTKRRNLPYGFTEHGILMLSSVLNSEIAISVNIDIMRTFNKMRKLIASHIELAQQLENLERSGRKNSQEIQKIWAAIAELYGFQEKENLRRIGF
ncbi:MAG: hypothetical protein LDLANPLL_00155 [Turneriella sp.]|nr:hypothetical protein [Turneriella sp.]